MRDLMLIFHLLGVVMAVGNYFAQFFLGIAASKMTIAESDSFLTKALYLNYMGKLGLTLLILSGGYLMTPYWGLVMIHPALFAKLVFVGIIIVLIVISSIITKKVKKEGGEKNLARLRNINFLSVLISVIIMILAVSVFH
jgi:uncharacterized membrane protein